MELTIEILNKLGIPSFLINFLKGFEFKNEEELISFSEKILE